MKMLFRVDGANPDASIRALRGAAVRPSVWLACVLVAGCAGGSLQLSPSFTAVHNTLTAMGFAQSGEIIQGNLEEGAVQRITAQLRAGDCYTLVAFGGEGVSDVDVLITDDTGTEVATDRTTDSQAAAQLCPEADGDYQVAVRMTHGGGPFVLTSWSGMSRGGGGRVATAGGGGRRGTCSTPIPLALGQSVRGATTGGANEMSGGCIQGSEAPEAVYSLTVDRRAQVAVTLTSDYDGVLYLLGACGEMRSEIACNDDDGSTSRSRVEVTLDPGTYYLVVDGYGDASGSFELTTEVRELQSLAQVCGGAQALVPGQAVSATTASQPGYFSATCAGGAQSPDRVYSLDVPARSRLRLRMQSTYDGAIYIRRDCQSPNSEVACNDDHQDAQHSMITTTLDAGRYYVYADGFGTDSRGDYSLRADLAPAAGGTATADNCSAAGVAAAGGEIQLDTFGASDDLAGSCGGQGAPDVVYRIDVAERSRLRARVATGEFPTALYLQRSCGQASTEVACASGGGPTAGPSELDTNVQPGTYFLVVDGTGPNEFGAARVEVQLENLQALEQACQQAPRIRPGRTITGDTSGSRDRFQATCAGGARSNDLVYRLDLPRRSTVRITSEQQYDGSLYIRRDCTDISTEIACNDDEGDNRHSLLETTLDRGTYYVFMDGFADSSQGSFTIDVAVTRP